MRIQTLDMSPTQPPNHGVNRRPRGDQFSRHTGGTTDGPYPDLVARLDARLARPVSQIIRSLLGDLFGSEGIVGALQRV